MKRFFLIPLMAFFSCVMAFATNVGTLQELKDALAAGGEITLTDDIDVGATAVTFSSSTATTLDLGEYTLSSSISASGDEAKGGLVISGGSLTIKGNGSITAANGNAILVSGGALIVKSGTISGKNEGIFATAGTITVEGGTMNGADDNAIFTRGQALTINGGTFTGGWGAIQADNNVVLTISGGNFTGADQEIALNAWPSIANANPIAVISGGTFNGKGIHYYAQGGTLSVTGGSFKANPAEYVDLASYVVTKDASSMYVVGTPADYVVAYNSSKATTYTSLSNAVEDANAGNVIYLYKDDVTAVTVDKNITIKTNGHSTNLSADAGYNRADMGQDIAFTDNAFAAFLMADGEAFYTIEEDINIASLGQIQVHGIKTLTVAEGATVTYQKQTDGENISVVSGAKLTLLGKGSFVGNSNVIAANGGEVVIGVENSNDQLHFTSSRTDGGNILVVSNGGKLTVNNADLWAACAALWVEGEGSKLIVNGGHIVGDGAQAVRVRNNGYFELNDGEIISNSSTKHGIYSYAVICEARAIINGGKISGIQGGFDVSYYNATADIYGGIFETRTDPNKGTAHYALYAAHYGVANVYGGKFKAADKRAIYCGNNDAYSVIGVVNLYGGMMATKAYVQNAPTNTYPASVPTSSQWYSSFGTDAPLPAGYEYYETGDETYPWGVKAIAGKKTDEIESTETTIPWQQSTTWVSDKVPEENTIVTIPVGKTVVVSNAEDDKEAVADQVFINKGASLTVETGTTLTVGDGGVNIANGGSVTVEPGAVVKIGAAGVITAEEDALVLESNDDTQAALLYDPAVEENTQPKATVKLTTKSKQIGANSYVFERFAIPTINGAVTSYSIEGGIPTTGLYNDASSFLQAVWGWNHETQDWYQLDRFKDMEPYKGYQLTNNTANGGLVYVFEGNLVGNADGNYNFVENGFHFFGNSYTADINIKTFLASLGSEVEKTVWVYDPYDKNFKTITERLSSGRVKYGNNEAIKDIRSMQAFLMYLSDGTSGTATVDYESAIWGNPKYNPSASPAPARERETVAEDWATIKVASANGQKDEFILLQSEEFSNAFENGADASKFMNKENINLYATTNVGNLAMVATDNIDRTVLAFAAGEATEYTISFEGVEGNEFTLRDIVTGAVVSMTEGATYTFTQEANTTNAARFEILGSAKLPTAIENVEAEAKAHGIYTIAGQFVGNDFNALSSGVYVVNGVKIVK